MPDKDLLILDSPSLPEIADKDRRLLQHLTNDTTKPKPNRAQRRKAARLSRKGVTKVS